MLPYALETSRELDLARALPAPVVVESRAAADAASRLSLPGPAWAPGSPPGRWPEAALPVSFHLGSPASRDLGADAGPELDVALRAWTLPACTGYRARYVGVAPHAIAADDGVNVVLVHDDAWPAALAPGAIAQTVVHLDASGDIRDADVHLNGVDWRFSLDGAPGTLDARSILVHELGHALGLGHASDARATMAPNGSGLRWRSLEADDVAGLCALYPGRGAGGCESQPCPDGYLCVARRCQRPGEARDVCSPCDPEVSSTCEAAGDDARCVDVLDPETATPLGRACGRACAVDADCGAGFACRSTTSAGDRQCVALDGCRSGAAPCATDAECGSARCRGGACLGPAPLPVDARAPAPPGGTPEAGPKALEPGGGGCACEASPGARPGATVAPALGVALAAALRGRRRRRDLG